MPSIVCDICQEGLDLSKFRFYECGHGFCVDCVELMKDDKLCSMCRAPKGKQPPHPIFAHLEEDSLETKTDVTVDLMGSVGAGTSTVKPGTIKKRISEILRNPEIDQATVRRLLESTQHLEERLEPLSWQLQMERDEKKALFQKVTDLVKKANWAGYMEKDLQKAKKSLALTLQNMDRVTADNKRLIKQRDEMIYDREKLHRMVDVERRKEADWEQHTAELENMLALKDQEVSLLKKKLKALSKTSRHKAPVQDANNSLIVL